MSKQQGQSLRVLVVDDEAVFRRELAGFLRDEGYDVIECGDGEGALEVVAETHCDLMLLDLALPGIDGVEVLRRIGQLSPEVVVLVMTAFASLETALEALHLGAFDYLKKPVRFGELRLQLEKIEAHRQVVAENQALRRQLSSRDEGDEIIGQSAAIQAVFDAIAQLEHADANVLITGESGVGKELVARAIHRHSPQAERPFLPINVSAIPESMLEAQLFGYRRGAFTGASREQKGIFVAANGGTVFLDEIGELPWKLQPRLLRAIEQKEIFPLGAEAPLQVSFRLLAATNRDLQAMVDEGRFRQDLYYRLNVFQIEVPPLRERREDIPLLVDAFAKQLSASLKKPLLGVRDEAMRQLVAADWPGNVRELRNVIERAAILTTESWIGAGHLPGGLSGPGARPPSLLLRDVLWAREVEHIQMVLQMTDGNKEEAAKLLGLSLAPLYRRLDKMQEEPVI